jgi:2-polyprenyl-3-methyl-5-hydroxy-6-metoxy-1,4-benzoquinol methylase
MTSTPITDTPAQAPLDAAAAEHFAGRTLEVFNDACIALMTSIGHQTGLFDTMVTLPPATSAEIAAASGLDERYVREWLNAMVTAHVVRYDAAARSYLLPAEHAACLTTAAGPENLARMMQYVALLAQVEQPIIECFRRGGGLSYADYPRFHQLMAEDSAAVADAALVDGILPLVPGLPDRLHDGIRVADVGCGSGHAVNVMAAAFPGSTFIGYDFSAEAIGAARAHAAETGLENARFEVLDVAALDETESFDLVTAFDAIHDQAHPATVLGNIARALRHDGTFLMVDIKASSNVEDNIALPWGAFLYTVSAMHCMSVSLGLGGDGLGTAWGEQLATSMLHDAGFASVEIKEVVEDPFNSYYVAVKA